ncbi:hypothetical protein [Streptomyces sp. NPDC048612]|uniref:hypothetical protein n=1 Tax=Streptomyces sp. NPDC048612 TaxID=3365579 RepID=UPI00371E1360
MDGVQTLCTSTVDTTSPCFRLQHPNVSADERSLLMPEPGTAPASSGCPAVISRTLFHAVEYPNLPILETLARKSHKHRFFKLADHGMNGAFHLDASWHHAWENAAAFIATTGATTWQALRCRAGRSGASRPGPGA